MDALQRECWFRSEQAAPASPRVDWDALQAYVERGRASTAAAVLLSGRAVLSVSVKDASQGDVASLPCGARSLLIEPDTGAIICRGINKFFDLSEVRDGWLSDPSLWSSSTYRLWAMRKMAGFVVTVFTLDGVHLEVMSKHAVAGPHVDAARELLEKLPASQQAQMASDLFDLSACASFECIRRRVDHQHPVLEEDIFDEQLVLIAVQRRAQRREESVALAALPAHAAAWGVRCAPAVELRESGELHAVLRSVEGWRCVYTPFTECPALAEGFVLVVECRTDEEKDASATWCCPIRLKVKTPRYTVLRALRSLVMGDSRPQSFLYHQALLAWLASTAPSVDEIRSTLAHEGVSQLADRFEASLQAKGRLRYRDAADTVGHALTKLMDVSARTACPRSHCPLFVLVLCGLPGAGKTTVSKALLHALASHQTPASSALGFAVHVSRDAVSRDVAQAHGIDADSSKHKQRRLRALVHAALCDALRDVSLWCLETQRPGLLILDACNATHASRQVWRRCFPSSLTAYQTAYVECPDTTVSAQRVGHRQNHEVLRSAAEAQHALYTVRKKFQPPSPEERCWHVDTSAATPEEAGRALLQRINEQQQADVQARPISGGSSLEVLDVSAIRAEMQRRHAALLHSLLDLSDATAMAPLHDVTAFLTSTSSTTNATQRQLQIRLESTSDALRDIAARVLCPTLGLAVEEAAPAASLASAGRRLVRRVAAALWGRGDTGEGDCTGNRRCAAGRVVRGHVKWLPGWLLHGKAVSTHAEVAGALLERFEHVVAQPHVTLLHSTRAASSLSDGEVQRFLAEAGLHLGQEVVVRVQSLLLDRHAMCFGVVLSSGLSTQGDTAATVEEKVRTPLHITVATATGTAAAYAGAMFASFATWQTENDALRVLQQAAVRQVSRSQSKFHNFVEYALDTEVALKGVVELQQQRGGVPMDSVADSFSPSSAP